MVNTALTQFINCSDTSFLIQLGTTVSQEVHQKVMALYYALKRQTIEGIVNLTPTYCSVMVIYDPMITTPNRLQPILKVLLADLLQRPPTPWGEVVKIPVCYGGNYGPDLFHVAQYCNLSPQEVIARHSAAEYPILVMGFSPGFSCLGNLDPKLQTPRHPTLRTRVPAGSIGIADDQTGVYAIASPGGWQLIGQTPLNLFQSRNARPFRYQVGDRLRFVPIKPEEYLQIKEKEAP